MSLTITYSDGSALRITDASDVDVQSAIDNLPYGAILTVEPSELASGSL